MKVGVAQTRPFVGNIDRNLDVHQRLSELAVDQQAKLVVFPELSLTGYEPTLAADLAMYADDRRLDRLQTVCDRRNISIAAGAPLRVSQGICISLIVLRPRQARY